MMAVALLRHGALNLHWVVYSGGGGWKKSFYTVTEQTELCLLFYNLQNSRNLIFVVSVTFLTITSKFFPMGGWKTHAHPPLFPEATFVVKNHTTFQARIQCSLLGEAFAVHSTALWTLGSSCLFACKGSLGEGCTHLVVYLCPEQYWTNHVGSLHI